MWGRRTLSVFFGLILACGVFLPAAQADDHDQMTKLSFDHPVEIPHQCLPAGTYWFVLAGGPNRNVVQVFTSDWSQELANLITQPVVRLEPTSRTEVTFAENPAREPEALLTWFYPGMLAGHQFVYRPRLQKEYAHSHQQAVVATTLKSRS